MGFCPSMRIAGVAGAEADDAAAGRQAIDGGDAVGDHRGEPEAGHVHAGAEPHAARLLGGQGEHGPAVGPDHRAVGHPAVAVAEVLGVGDVADLVDLGRARSRSPCPRLLSAFAAKRKGARRLRGAPCRGRIGPMHGAIDVHTHILPPGWDDWAARFGGAGWPRLVGDPTGPCQLYLGATFNRNLGPDSFDPAPAHRRHGRGGDRAPGALAAAPAVLLRGRRRGRGGVRAGAERQHRRRRRPAPRSLRSGRPRCRCSRPTSR